MGRVYDALKRAAQQNGAADEKDAVASSKREHARAAPNDADETTAIRPRGEVEPRGAVVERDAPELQLGNSRHFKAPDAALNTAPTGRTGTPGGSALPGGATPRDAGATLGAAGSARTPEFVTLDISAARVEPHLAAIIQPHSPHAERFRALRTRVLHAGERKRLQAFVITSAGVMEGKTLTAVNLSWLLAQTDGVRALLIDGDLRHPCAADYLGLDAPTGLSEVLAGEATLADAILRLEPAGLHLLPGGSRRDNVAEILSGPTFSEVLREARSMFDYIIIDAPPLAVFTDAAVLINRADAALIVARANRTRYAELERVLEPLPRERLLGVVLNDSNEELSEANYYYYRRYPRRGVEDDGGGGQSSTNGHASVVVAKASEGKE